MLTQLSLWWFEQLADLVPNHVSSSTDVPAEVRRARDALPAAGDVPGRVRGPRLPHRLRAGRVRARPARCAASPLPAGLVDGSRLPEPIFTPATKAAMGEHDENVTFDDVVATVGADVAAELRGITLAVYARAARDRPRARHRARRHQARVRPRRRRPRWCWPTRC